MFKSRWYAAALLLIVAVCLGAWWWVHAQGAFKRAITPEVARVSARLNETAKMLTPGGRTTYRELFAKLDRDEAELEQVAAAVRVAAASAPPERLQQVAAYLEGLQSFLRTVRRIHVRMMDVSRAEEAVETARERVTREQPMMAVDSHPRMRLAMMDLNRLKDQQATELDVLKSDRAQLVKQRTALVDWLGASALLDPVLFGAEDSSPNPTRPVP